MAKVASFCALAAGGLFAAAVACSPFGGASAFTCERDDQCTPGTCHTDGLCVTTDDQCSSGLRYLPNSGDKSGTCVGGDMMQDAQPIDAPTMCTPNAKECFQTAIETCRADGMGYDMAMRDQCAIDCTMGATPMCVGAASNIPLADQKACNANGMAPPLAPTSGTVTISDNMIVCSAGCGTANMIPRTSATPNSFFCLASITIPAGVNVTFGTATTGVTLFSHGNVVLNGNIDFDGKDATGTFDADGTNDLPGIGGPGGFTGGVVANAGDGPGQPGAGPTTNPNCGGRGGAVGSTGGDAAGGGGGGAGNAGTGGDGGDARSNLNVVGAGGANGVNTNCSTAEARPLVGGGGGGGGADGGCAQNQECGWPGGGGGGALHIVSRRQISGTGTITASGGNGYGEAAGNGGIGGGGGGGAGGMILLEAPTLMFGGPLQVNGGNGGPSLQGNGSIGAAGANLNATDANDVGNNQGPRGGPGGGGGGGRIRINATSGASCATASPAAACMTGTLRTAP